MRKALLALLLIISFSSFAKDGQPSFLLIKNDLVSVDHILYISETNSGPEISYENRGTASFSDATTTLAEAKRVIDPFPSPCKGIGCDKSKIVKYIEINAWDSKFKGRQVFVNTSKIVRTYKVTDNNYYLLSLTDDMSISMNNTPEEIAKLIYPEKPICRNWVLCSKPICRNWVYCSRPDCRTWIVCSEPDCRVWYRCSEPICKVAIYC